MRSFILAAVAALGFIITGPARAEPPAGPPLVDAAWLKSHLNNPGIVVVDIRSEGSAGSLYQKGHIPGSVYAPYGKFGWRTKVDNVVGQLPPVPEIAGRIGSLGIDGTKHVIIVPAGENSTDFGSATRVYWTFKVLGHDAVSILDGGFRAWIGAGSAVSTDAVTPKVVAFNATLRPELIADAAVVAKARKSGIALVDARPKAQYLGQSKSPVARAAGTIPGAVNIEQSSFYDDKTGAFSSKQAIADLVEKAGVSPNGQEIAFCNTGHWASVAWFGLSEVLGNKKTKLYDGSMADWTADPSRPVETKAVE